MSRDEHGRWDRAGVVAVLICKLAIPEDLQKHFQICRFREGEGGTLGVWAPGRERNHLEHKGDSCNRRQREKVPQTSLRAKGRTEKKRR